MKKSILVITPRFPYPVVGGDRLRIYQICKELSKKYRISLLSLCDQEDEISMATPQDGVFSSIERIYHPRWRSWLNCVLALPSKTPLQVAYYKNQEFIRRCAALSKSHDAIFAHLIRVGAFITHLPGVKLLEMTDAISLNYERIRERGHSMNDLRSHIFSHESRRLRRFEKSIVDNFDHCFLVSEIDRQFLFRDDLSRLARVTVSSNGVDLGNMPFQFSDNGNDIIFIGNMFSLQNLDAANFMASEVIPKIRAKYPLACLRLIGRIRAEDASRLAKIEGVKVTGEVPDVAVAARDGAVGVCPLRLGAGVQNKILEYMALGLPTVSTSLGLEGFEARNGRELLVADDVTGLSNSILRLLINRDEAKSIAVAARAYVEANHSWEAQLAPMVIKVNDLFCHS